jgi:hypothetical protein
MIRWSSRMLVRFAALAFFAAAALAQPASLFQQVDEMTASLSEITGWKVVRKVPAEMLGKEKFRRYVETQMKEHSKHDELRAEEIALKMFGFVPQDFDLASETVDLVSEQAAAFYDYNKKRLFVLDSTAEGNEQRVALVHELAHALADQHHPLGKYLRKGSPDDDGATARQAVMEGQATWLTWAYVSKRNGGKGEVPPSMLDELAKALGADGTDFPVFSKAPLYVRESLVFPYNQGMRFQDAVYRKLGRAAFDELFANPPASTQQILHPDAYFAKKKPLGPEPPSLESVIGKKEAHQYRALAEGSLGEFDHQVLLRQHAGEQESLEASSHWRGGAFRLYEHRPDKKPVLVYISEWDSPEAAHKVFELYQKVMQGKWKQTTLILTSANPNLAEGTGDSGRFRLTVEGTKVQSIEGLR